MKNHIVIHVEGGVCNYEESNGVRVFFFDWDNLEQVEDVETFDAHIEDAEAMPGGRDKRETLARLREMRARFVEATKED